MSPDPARPRYFVMVFARLAGVAVAIFGLLALNGNIAGVTPLAGGVFLVIGMAVMAVVPVWMARRWRTPPRDESGKS